MTQSRHDIADRTSAETPDTERFVALLTAHQSRLYAFVYSLIADADLAADVFQETNMVLWSKANEFDHAREFLPWALAVARNQVRAARQKRGRDRHVFDDQTLELLADAAGRRVQRLPARMVALAACLRRLPEKHRQLVDLRYRQQHSLQQVADVLGRTLSAVTVALHRVRQTLARCISDHLARDAQT
jgi:RNA polymerase sigma-70 factor (ECF subfamily)